jgi:hypothetical protein
MNKAAEFETTQGPVSASSAGLGFLLGMVIYTVWMRLPSCARYSRPGMWALAWAGYYANAPR